MYLLPFIKGGLTMKKLFKHLTFALLLGSLGFGLAQRNKDVVRADAASPTTHRVWVHTHYLEWWKNDDAETWLHYWGDDEPGTTWPGIKMNHDAANDLYYLDVPTTVEKAVVARVQPDTTNAWNQTINVDLIAGGPHFNTRRVELWNEKTFDKYNYGTAAFTPVTTTAVSAFAATIDTTGEACSAVAAQAAIDAYNDLPTFEQNQYAALDVGGGKTGMDRLNYLKAFYNINTPIGSSVSGRIPSSDNSATATLIISALGVSSLAGYYFISKKKLFG